ncbi:MAG: amidophosphoribosyltransferase, partial [Clostridia bacterium]|nr:amidophosphoribosyltransferase [Clostridia bacterium]
KDIPTGIRAAQKKIDGSMSMLVMTSEGIYAARDLYGRTPLMIGKKDGAFCASFESFAFINLGYVDHKELGPGEIVYITPDGCVDIMPPEKKKKVCAFLWVYFGYPASCYEGVNVEDMRYRCGAAMARADKERTDSISGVPDSGIAHAIGYAAESGVPYSRPLVKYTPTWPRSFMPPKQSSRELIAKMKIIPIVDLIRDKRLMLIDDSIVRGTQMRETAEILYAEGAKEVHVRPACPPLLYGCKYLNFSRSTSDMDLIARRVIAEREVEITDEILAEYADPDSERYKAMVEEIGKRLHFTSLVYNRLDDMLDSVGIDKECLCTYCWNGKE